MTSLPPTQKTPIHWVDYDSRGYTTLGKQDFPSIIFPLKNTHIQRI